MEEFNLDKVLLLTVVIIIICIIYPIGEILYSFSNRNFTDPFLLFWISMIIVAIILLKNLKDIIRKLDPPNAMCEMWLENINEWEDHKLKLIANEKNTDDDNTDDDDNDIGDSEEDFKKAILPTHDNIVIIERSYACVCDDSDANMLEDDKPKNKKGKWKIDGEIKEMTYKERYEDICGNTCKSENRPLDRCDNNNDCRYPGDICYLHPYIKETNPNIKGVCISNIRLSNLESLIDIYNSEFCELDSNGSTDYSCGTMVEGTFEEDFKNTKKDIINFTLMSDNSKICYSPFEELKEISSYDDENNKYILGLGNKCCVPLETTADINQVDKVASFLKQNYVNLLEGVAMIFVQDLFIIFVDTGVRLGWEVGRHGKSLARAGKEMGEALSNSWAVKGGKFILKGLLKVKNLIIKCIKLAFYPIKAMFQLLIGSKNLSVASIKIGKVIAILTSKLSKGAKIFNDMRKAVTNSIKGSIKGGKAAAEVGIEQVGAKAAAEAAERKAAAMATKRALAKATETAAAETASTAGNRLLNFLPGVGQVLLAIQIAGIVMDEMDVGGFQNIVKNSEVIDQTSEVMEGQMLWMYKNYLQKEPPFTIDLVNTFFTDDNKDEGSSWPFNLSLITDANDKKNADFLVKLVSVQKTSEEKFTLNKLAEQITKYTDTIKDPDIAKAVMEELYSHSNDDSLSKKGKESKIQDYFNESITSFLEYDITKEDCEKRDQYIYDTMINSAGFSDNELKYYLNKTDRKFYYNNNALVYLNKELSSPEYSGIVYTPKAINLFNRYRNLREEQQYIAYSKYYLDIAYSESNKDYPNGMKHHMEKLNISNSSLIKSLNLSKDNPIFTQGIPQYTMMNDLESICQYGGMIGKPNYEKPGIHGMFMDGVSGEDLSKTWLKGGDNPTLDQPFANYSGISGIASCRDNCNENYNAEKISEETAKIRKENYHNRIMSWNYADKSNWYDNDGAWGNNSNDSSERMKAPIAMYGANRELSCLGCGKGTNSPHAKVIDDDNRICIITEDYCQDFGEDFKPNNAYSGKRPQNRENYFDLKYGDNFREYNDCHAGYTHQAISWILGDSLTAEMARWL